ncbi:MAG: vitamin K epoxide reductase family protein [Candidatus Nanopelagicales bacterium]
MTDTDTFIAPDAEPDAEPDADSAAPSKSRVRHRGAYIEMLISSVLGLIASFVLSVDALAIAADPDAEFSCDISATISCGAVGRTWQAELLGFPNAFLGLITEPVVITVALAALGGVRFPRWFMITAQVFYSIGLIFAYWLFYQAYFNIHALCPWCLLITATTTFVFTSITRVNILDGHLGEGVRRKLTPALRYNADTVGAVLVLAIIAAMVTYTYL